MAEVEAVIERLEALMERLDEADQAGAVEPGVRFLESFFQLGASLGEGRWDVPAVASFRERWLDRIDMVMLSVSAFHAELAHELSLGHLMDLGPEAVCRLYSGGRFVYDLFGDDAFEVARAFSEADEYLEELADALAAEGGVDEVPDGVPESHTWWWVEAADAADELPPC